MTFNQYLNQAWDAHAAAPEKAIDELKVGVLLVERIEQLIQLAQFATHVYGEHLGRWDEGIQFLQSLRSHPSFVPTSDEARALLCQQSALTLAAGQPLTPELGLAEQVRVYSLAAAALCGQNRIDVAARYFNLALAIGESGLAHDDPANRALAVASNNLAATLEEKFDLSVSEQTLMIDAAKAARRFWGVAGGWLETERAEYRLAKSYLKANDATTALTHAHLLLEICRIHNAPPLEFFFGHEVAAHSYNQLNKPADRNACWEHMNSLFKQLDESDQAWCRETLDKISSIC